MKRKLIIYMILATTLLFSGCGNNNTPSSEATPTPKADTSAPTATADNTQSATEPVASPAVEDNFNNDYDVELNSQTSSTTEDVALTEDEAKAIALAKVPGATTQDIRDFHADYEDGHLEYEGEIYYNNTEYDFEIDGYTGEILDWDVETADER